MRPILILMASGLTAASLYAEPLDAILARMDSSARSSTSFSANVRWVEFTRVLKESREQVGTLKLRKQRGGHVIGRMDIDKPAPYTWHFAESAWERYAPASKLLTVYDSKLVKSADQYLLLVFGLTGNELKKAYTLTGGPEETVAGVRTTRLDLVPKDKDAREMASKVELWVVVGQTYAVQVKATQPNGNYNQWLYPEAKVNPGLPDAAFDFVPPAGATREVIRK
jgi:hypothetical protein